MPKFSKRHYEVIATTFNEVYNDSRIGPLGRSALEMFLGRLIIELKEDNNLFDKDKFNKKSYKMEAVTE